MLGFFEGGVLRHDEPPDQPADAAARSCIGFTYIGKSNVGESHAGKPYVGKSNAIK